MSFRGQMTHSPRAATSTCVPRPSGQSAGLTLCWKPWWNSLSQAVPGQLLNQSPQGGTLSTRSINMAKKAPPSITFRCARLPTSNTTSRLPTNTSASATPASGPVGPPWATPKSAWESRCGTRSSRKWLNRAQGQASQGRRVTFPIAAPAKRCGVAIIAASTRGLVHRLPRPAKPQRAVSEPLEHSESYPEPEFDVRDDE